MRAAFPLCLWITLARIMAVSSKSAMRENRPGLVLIAILLLVVLVLVEIGKHACRKRAR